MSDNEHEEVAAAEEEEQQPQQEEEEEEEEVDARTLGAKKRTREPPRAAAEEEEEEEKKKPSHDQAAAAAEEEGEEDAGSEAEAAEEEQPADAAEAEEGNDEDSEPPATQRPPAQPKKTATPATSGKKKGASGGGGGAASSPALPKDKELYPGGQAERDAAQGRQRACEDAEKQGVHVRPLDDATVSEDLAYYAAKQTSTYSCKSIRELRKENPDAVVAFWLPRLTVGDVLACAAGKVRREHFGVIVDREGYRFTVMPVGAAPPPHLPRTIKPEAVEKERSRLTGGQTDDTKLVKLPQEDWMLVCPPLAQIDSNRIFKSMIGGAGRGVLEVLRAFEHVVPVRLLINRRKETLMRPTKKKATGAAAESSASESGGGGKPPASKKQKTGGASSTAASGASGSEELASHSEVRASARSAETSATRLKEVGGAKVKTQAPNGTGDASISALQRESQQVVEEMRAKLAALIDKKETHYVEQHLAKLSFAEILGEKPTPVDALVDSMIRDPSEIASKLPLAANWLSNTTRAQLEAARKAPDAAASKHLLSMLSPTEDLLREAGKSRPLDLPGAIRAAPIVCATVAATLRKLLKREVEWRKQYDELIQSRRHAETEFSRITRESLDEAAHQHKRAEQEHAEVERLRNELTRLKEEYEKLQAARSSADAEQGEAMEVEERPAAAATTKKPSASAAKKSASASVPPKKRTREDVPAETPSAVAEEEEASAAPVRPPPAKKPAMASQKPPASKAAATSSAAAPAKKPAATKKPAPPPPPPPAEDDLDLAGAGVDAAPDL